jgi:hypothetical protein
MILDGLNSLLKATRGDVRTIIGRCIVVAVKRAPDGYRPPRFDKQARSVAKMISERNALWMAQEVADGIEDYVPEMPEGIGKPRRVALWESLVAVCDRAGGEWPGLIREAFVQLESADLPDESDDQAAELDRTIAAWQKQAYTP